MPRTTLFRKRWCSAESTNSQRSGLRRAGRACTSTFSWREDLNDARDPPPEVALAASRRLDSRRKDLPDRHGSDDFFRKRRRQPAVEPPAGKPFGTDDQQEIGRAHV